MQTNILLHMNTQLKSWFKTHVQYCIKIISKRKRTDLKWNSRTFQKVEFQSRALKWPESFTGFLKFANQLLANYREWRKFYLRMDLKFSEGRSVLALYAVNWSDKIFSWFIKLDIWDIMAYKYTFIESQSQ
jgi:hypothetical protein